MTTVVIWVADLEKSAQYYKDLFQCHDYYLVDGFASVAGSGNEVLLHLLPEQYRAEPSIGSDNPIKPVFQIDSAEQARTVAQLHGTSFSANVQQHGQSGYLDGLDPDGHVIQVSFPLS